VRRLAVVLAAALLPGAAAAGELRLEAEGGYFELSSAEQAARAVFGSKGGPLFGLAVSFAARGSGPFARVGARRWSRSGERAFAADVTSPVFRLGHPLEVRITPVYALVGWRLALGSVTPYLGAGAGVTGYREESTVAEITTEESRRKAAYHLAAGAELFRGPLRLGVELGWSSVPGALGTGGISERFGQTNAGGLSVVGRVVFVP
jgi:opacity protein-like surface antigen